MPCNEPSHHHEWPDKGELVIEKCERYCAYCTGAHARHEWKFAWFLRRHVRTVHLKSGDKPNVTVSEGWAEKPYGMPKTPRNKTKILTIRTTPQTPTPASRSARRKKTRSTTKTPKTPKTPSTPSPMKIHPQSSGRLGWKGVNTSTPDATPKSSPEASDTVKGETPSQEIVSSAQSRAYVNTATPVQQAAPIANMAPVPMVNLALIRAFREAIKDLTTQGLRGGVGQISIAELYYIEAQSLGLRRR